MLLPQPNQQSKTTQNNFGWGGTIISKKTRIASATWHHSLRNMGSQPPQHGVITSATWRYSLRNMASKPPQHCVIASATWRYSLYNIESQPPQPGCIASAPSLFSLCNMAVQHLQHVVQPLQHIMSIQPFLLDLQPPSQIQNIVVQLQYQSIEYKTLLYILKNLMFCFLDLLLYHYLSKSY